MSKTILLINDKHVITAYWNENYAIYEYYKDCSCNYLLNNEKVKIYADKVVRCNCYRGTTCKETEEEDIENKLHYVETKEIETNITEKNYLSLEQVKTYVKSVLFEVKTVSIIPECCNIIPLKRAC